jgi:hypothetical protein
MAAKGYVAGGAGTCGGDAGGHGECEIGVCGVEAGGICRDVHGRNSRLCGVVVYLASVAIGRDCLATIFEQQVEAGSELGDRWAGLGAQSARRGTDSGRTSVGVVSLKYQLR